MKNESGKFLVLAHDGRIVEGAGHPDGRVVLAAPGVDVPMDFVHRHPGLADALKAPAPKPEAKAAEGPPEAKAVAAPPETRAIAAPQAAKAQPGGKVAK